MILTIFNIFFLGVITYILHQGLEEDKEPNESVRLFMYGTFVMTVCNFISLFV